MLPKQERGVSFSATVQSTANAVASVAAGGANTIHYITDISGSADKNGATITVRSGGTTLWQDQLAMPYSLATTNIPYTRSFVSPLAAGTNTAVTVTVGSASSLSWANVSGFTIVF